MRREREEWLEMGHLLITKYDHFYVLCCSRFSWSPRAISFLAPRRVDSSIVVVICLEFLLTSMSGELLARAVNDEKKVGVNGEPQIKRFLGELEFVTGRIEAAKFDALFGVNCSDRGVMDVGKVRRVVCQKSSGVGRKSSR